MFLVLPTGAARADIAVLEPVKDNTLYEEASGLLANGAGSHFFAGRTGAGRAVRGLLEFDVAGSLPAGATVTSASLALNMSLTRNSVPETVSLQRALAEWGEGASDAPGGEGLGTQSAPGDATWLHTFFDTEFWGQAGGDFLAVPSASASVGGPGAYTWGPTRGMSIDVQGWLDDPGGNHGWILIGNEVMPQTAKAFHSRQHPLAEMHPMLTVEFLTVTDDEDEDEDEAA